jgi:hypothetical protein
MRTVCDHCGPQDAEQNIFGQLGFGLNHLGYVLMRSPSPVLMCCTHSDFFPFGGSLETAAIAKKVFAVLDSSENFGFFDVGGPHHWFESQQQASFAWMKDRFGITKDAFAGDGYEFKKLDVNFSYDAVDVGFADNDRPQRHMTDEGKVTPRGYVLDLPGARSVYDIMREEKIRTAVLDGTFSPDVLRKVAGFRKRGQLSWEVAGVKEIVDNGVKVRTASILLPGMIRVPTVTFIPAVNKGRAALVVSDLARTRLADKVRSLLREGRSVMVAELRAFGETGKNCNGNPYGFYGCKDADEKIALMCYWLGESLVGHRSEDVICAAMALCAETGSKSVDLYCEGRSVIPAAHAFYAERELFAEFVSEREPKGWAWLIADKNCEQYRFANVVHGALRFYDWTDLIAR